MLYKLKIQLVTMNSSPVFLSDSHNLCEKCYNLPRAQGGNFKFLVLSEHQPQTQRYSISNDIEQTNICVKTVK